MSTVTMEEAQATLPELIDKISQGEEVVITRNSKPIAQLIRMPGDGGPQPIPGRCEGMLTILSDDDEHLKDWAEYMP